MSAGAHTPGVQVRPGGLLFATLFTTVNLIVLAILINLVITQFDYLPDVGLLAPDQSGAIFLLVAGVQAGANGLFLMARKRTRRLGAGTLLGCLAALGVGYLLSWLGPSGTGF